MGDLEAACWPVYRPNYVLVVFFRDTLWSMRLEESGPLRKRLMDLTIVGDDATITARGGRSFAPQSVGSIGAEFD